MQNTHARLAWLSTLSLALLSLPWLAGCSLMGLDDIDLPQCQSDQDCIGALNASAGLYDGCHAFACVPSGDRQVCQRIEGEICDGFDNDCDRLVDEANAGTQVFSPTIDRRADAPGTILADIDVSSDGDQQVLASWSVENGSLHNGWTALLNSPAPTPQQLGYQTNMTTNLRTTTLTDPAAPGDCGGLASDGPNCEIGDVVRASGARGTFTATVNVDGCTAGLLRVTETATVNPEQLIDRGPGRRSSVYRGVARIDGGKCSENSSTECRDAIDAGTGIGTSCGVTRPAIAHLPSDPPQGLVAFLGAPDRTPSCDGLIVPVEALGVYRRGSAARGFEWIDGAQEGRPTALGMSKGGGRPGVLTLLDAGYLVAYGNANGHLAMHFIPRLPDPPANSGLCEITDLTCDLTMPEDRTGVMTPDLPAPIDFPEIAQAFAGQVDDVRLRLGRVMGSAIEVGVTYREGCTPTESAIVFRRMRLDLTATDETMLTDSGSPVKVNADEQVQGNPALIHLDDGFVSPGYQSDGMTADDSALGGFLVAWPAGQDRLLARRISDLTGVPLQPTAQAEFIVLSQRPSSAGAQDPSVRSVSFFVDANGPSFAYYDRANTDIAAGVLACPAAPGR